MSLDVNNLDGSKETMKLLDFAKSVTESIKCALERPNKSCRKKKNHRKYIQRKCFTKPGSQRKASKRISEKIISDGTLQSVPSGDVPNIGDLKSMLEEESERYYMSYMYMKENNEFNGHDESYSHQHESYFNYNGTYDSLPVTPGITNEHDTLNNWQGYWGVQYPPKLKHIDYEQLMMNQQRQGRPFIKESYLSALNDDRIVYEYPQMAWHNMYYGIGNSMINGYTYTNRTVSSSTTASH